MWQPLAEILVKDHTVAKILDELDANRFALVTHDIGNMVGYALAAQFPDRVDRWAVMDAPFPGLGTWKQQFLNPRVWHFNFRGPDVERLVAARRRSELRSAHWTIGRSLRRRRDRLEGVSEKNSMTQDCRE